MNTRDETNHPMTETLVEGEYYLSTLIVDDKPLASTEERCHVVIGKPAKDPLPGGDMYCPFDIEFRGKTISAAVFGIDELQAVEQAYVGIRAILLERTT